MKGFKKFIVHFKTCRDRGRDKGRESNNRNTSEILARNKSFSVPYLL
jgi:hypothetical protein